VPESSVDIICPRCFSKAKFYSELVGTYKMYPNKNGNVVCRHCGFAGQHVFSNKDYYYQVEVGKRTLYARNLENLISLRDYFQEGYKSKPKGDPEHDFPQEFYVNREEIVKKINSVLTK
jgi:hypothetical protein